VTYVNYGGAQQDGSIPRREVFWTVESVNPVAVATGVFGLDLCLGEGFKGDGEELPLCSVCVSSGAGGSTDMPGTTAGGIDNLLLSLPTDLLKN